MSTSHNSLDTDQNMSNGSNAENSGLLLQLPAQLVQGQRTFEQAVTQLLSQPAAVAPLVQQPSVQKASVAEPDDYNRRYEAFDTFMSQLYLMFSGKPTTYANDQMKIISTLSYMKKGFTATWAMSITKELRDGTRTFQTWGAFEEKLKEMFDDPNKKHLAQVKLHALKKISKQSADKYFAEFDQLTIALTDFNGEALLDILH